MKGAKTVFVGERFNQLAINNPNTICEAGGYVNDGSATVFAEQCAVARELDGTSEQWRIAEGSGVPHLLVG